MKILVLVLVAVVRFCRAEVVIASSIPDKSTSDLTNDLVTIVTSCNGPRIAEIGLAGEFPSNVLRVLSTRLSIPVVLIDNTMTSNSKPSWVPLNIRHKLPMFIVGATSSKQLKAILDINIQSTIWWNHMASFIIIDWSPACKMIADDLIIAWSIGILNANVMCYRDKSGRRVFTFNPFTSLAPAPWQKVAKYDGYANHPFSVFTRKLQNNEAICVNFDFDKAKDFGGYPIGVSGYPPKNLVHNKSKRRAYAYAITEQSILLSIHRAVKLTPVYRAGTNYKGDMGSHVGWLGDSWNTSPVTYPHTQFEFVLLSQFRGNKSQLNKILSFGDINTRIGVGLAYLVTLIFFKFVVRQALLPAILNLVRVTSGTGFENIPRNNPARIYLTGILFLAVTMHGIFEGNSASLLTTAIPLRNVNTMKDILDFNYTIYGPYNAMRLLEPELQGRYVWLNSLLNCVTKAHQEKTSACLCVAENSALDLVKTFNLHSSGKIVSDYGVFDIAWNCFYEERINIVLLKIVEADVLQPWHVKCNPVRMENFQIDEDVTQNKDFKSLELGELTFAFVILGIGLGLASIIFLFELRLDYRFRCDCRVEIEERTIRT